MSQQTYSVLLNREYRVQVGAYVDVEAASPAEALQKALEMSGKDEVPGLNYPDGEENTTYGQVDDGNGGILTGQG